MAEFASKGVAGTGLGLGIAGTALGLLNGNGNGILGGLFGNGVNTATELAGLGAVNELAKKEAELAKEKAERYTDQQVLGSVKGIFDEFRKEDEKIAGVLKDVTTGFLEVGNAVSRMDKEIECIKTTMTKDQEINALKMANVKSELSGAIALESERRVAGDQNLYCYVNSTFVPGKLVMPLSSLCPQAMPRYNEWQAPDSGTQVTVSHEPGTVAK